MKWLIYDAKWLKLMLWFLGYFISKFENRQIDGSCNPSVKKIAERVETAESDEAINEKTC